MRITTDRGGDGPAVLLGALFLAGILLAACASRQVFAQEAEAPPPTGWSEGRDCISAGCHDELLKERYVHEAAAEGCDICHEEGGAHEFSMPPGDEICLDCHDDGEGYWDHADGGAECVECHDPHSARWAHQLRMPARKLCQDCHGLGEDMESGSVHPPVSEGRCLKCHHPHRVAGSPLLARPFEEICVECHRRIIYPGVENPEPHGGDNPESCDECHEIHESEYQKLLRDQYAEGVYTTDPESDFALCFGCHDADDLLRSDDTGFITDDDRNLHEIHVLREGKGRGCRACHKMHSNDLPYMAHAGRPMGNWTARLDLVITDSSKTCAPACHEPRSYRAD